MQTTPPSIATSDFYPAFYEVSSTIPVYVPCYSVSAYHSSDWGSKFSNIKGFSSDTTITAHINQGEIYTLNDFNADSTGVYVNATENADGCYALKILYLTVDSTIGLEYVSNNDNQFSALIYPNPATNNATLKIENLKDKAQVEVYNIQGRQISKQVMNAGQRKLDIDVKNWAKGVYSLIVVTNGRNIINHKLLVQ